ncbi:hypothetical protein EVAR_89096_1 [Eumeta japonica]|uniref:Uncharacterized protein n=1 Tax=Eumeta variegata TaxID=151549 RepID=A0A4C1XCZ6_EUMVA|nr:hypothetical protein EVAR_89096_1 [Eumeta japonica]
MKRSTHQFSSARSWSTLRSRFYTSDGDDSSWSRRGLVISHTVDYDGKHGFPRRTVEGKRTALLSGQLRLISPCSTMQKFCRFKLPAIVATGKFNAH